MNQTEHAETTVYLSLDASTMVASKQVYIEYEKVRGIEALPLENRSLYRVLREQFEIGRAHV